jgi:hypothetical protein
MARRKGQVEEEEEEDEEEEEGIYLYPGPGTYGTETSSNGAAMMPREHQSRTTTTYNN